MLILVLKHGLKQGVSEGSAPGPSARGLASGPKFVWGFAVSSSNVESCRKLGLCSQTAKHFSMPW